MKLQHSISEVVGDFTRVLQIFPAWDKTSTDPSKNYGIHSMDLRCYLKGKKGVVQFVLYTGWYLNKNSDPCPCDIGYHSYTPTYEGQEVLRNECELLDGKPCYYDGSGLHATEFFKKFKEIGLDGLWGYLESYYNEILK